MFAFLSNPREPNLPPAPYTMCTFLDPFVPKVSIFRFPGAIFELHLHLPGSVSKLELTPHDSYLIVRGSFVSHAHVWKDAQGRLATLVWTDGPSGEFSRDIPICLSPGTEFVVLECLQGYDYIVRYTIRNSGITSYRCINNYGGDNANSYGVSSQENPQHSTGAVIFPESGFSISAGKHVDEVHSQDSGLWSLVKEEVVATSTSTQPVTGNLHDRGGSGVISVTNPGHGHFVDNVRAPGGEASTILSGIGCGDLQMDPPHFVDVSTATARCDAGEALVDGTNAGGIRPRAVQVDPPHFVGPSLTSGNQNATTSGNPLAGSTDACVIGRGDVQVDPPHFVNVPLAATGQNAASGPGHCLMDDRDTMGIRHGVVQVNPPHFVDTPLVSGDQKTTTSGGTLAGSLDATVIGRGDVQVDPPHFVNAPLASTGQNAASGPGHCLMDDRYNVGIGPGVVQVDPPHFVGAPLVSGDQNTTTSGGTLAGSTDATVIGRGDAQVDPPHFVNVPLAATGQNAGSGPSHGLVDDRYNVGIGPGVVQVDPPHFVGAPLVSGDQKTTTSGGTLAGSTDATVIGRGDAQVDPPHFVNVPLAATGQNAGSGPSHGLVDDRDNVGIGHGVVQVDPPHFVNTPLASGDQYTTTAGSAPVGNTDTSGIGRGDVQVDPPHFVNVPLAYADQNAPSGRIVADNTLVGNADTAQRLSATADALHPSSTQQTVSSEIAHFPALPGVTAGRVVLNSNNVPDAADQHRFSPLSAASRRDAPVSVVWETAKTAPSGAPHDATASEPHAQSIFPSSQNADAPIATRRETGNLFAENDSVLQSVSTTGDRLQTSAIASSSIHQDVTATAEAEGEGTRTALPPNTTRDAGQRHVRFEDSRLTSTSQDASVAASHEVHAIPSAIRRGAYSSEMPREAAMELHAGDTAGQVSSSSHSVSADAHMSGSGKTVEGGNAFYDATAADMKVVYHSAGISSSGNLHAAVSSNANTLPATQPSTVESGDRSVPTPFTGSRSTGSQVYRADGFQSFDATSTSAGVDVSVNLNEQSKQTSVSGFVSRDFTEGAHVPIGNVSVDNISSLQNVAAAARGEEDHQSGRISVSTGPIKMQTFETRTERGAHISGADEFNVSRVGNSGSDSRRSIVAHGEDAERIQTTSASVAGGLATSFQGVASWSGDAVRNGPSSSNNVSGGVQINMRLTGEGGVASYNATSSSGETIVDLAPNFASRGVTAAVSSDLHTDVSTGESAAIVHGLPVITVSENRADGFNSLQVGSASERATRSTGTLNEHAEPGAVVGLASRGSGAHEQISMGSANVDANSPVHKVPALQEEAAHQLSSISISGGHAATQSFETETKREAHILRANEFHTAGLADNTQESGAEDVPSTTGDLATSVQQVGDISNREEDFNNAQVSTTVQRSVQDHENAFQQLGSTSTFSSTQSGIETERKELVAQIGASSSALDTTAAAEFLNVAEHISGALVYTDVATFSAETKRERTTEQVTQTSSENEGDAEFVFVDHPVAGALPPVPASFHGAGAVSSSTGANIAIVTEQVSRNSLAESRRDAASISHIGTSTQLESEQGMQSLTTESRNDAVTGTFSGAQHTTIDVSLTEQTVHDSSETTSNIALASHTLGSATHVISESSEETTSRLNSVSTSTFKETSLELLGEHVAQSSTSEVPEYRNGASERLDEEIGIVTEEVAQVSLEEASNTVVASGGSIYPVEVLEEHHQDKEIAIVTDEVAQVSLEETSNTVVTDKVAQVSLEETSNTVVASGGSIYHVEVLEEHRQDISQRLDVASTSAEDNVAIAVEQVTQASKMEDSVYDLATATLRNSLRTPIEYGESSQNADVVSRSASANAAVVENQNLQMSTQEYREDTDQHLAVFASAGIDMTISNELSKKASIEESDDGSATVILRHWEKNATSALTGVDVVTSGEITPRPSIVEESSSASASMIARESQQDIAKITEDVLRSAEVTSSANAVTIAEKVERMTTGDAEQYFDGASTSAAENFLITSEHGRSSTQEVFGDTLVRSQQSVTEHYQERLQIADAVADVSASVNTMEQVAQIPQDERSLDIICPPSDVVSPSPNDISGIGAVQELVQEVSNNMLAIGARAEATLTAAGQSDDFLRDTAAYPSAELAIPTQQSAEASDDSEFRQDVSQDRDMTSNLTVQDGGSHPADLVEPVSVSVDNYLANGSDSSAELVAPDSQSVENSPPSSDRQQTSSHECDASRDSLSPPALGALEGMNSPWHFVSRSTSATTVLTTNTVTSTNQNFSTQIGGASTSSLAFLPSDGGEGGLQSLGTSSRSVEHLIYPAPASSLDSLLSDPEHAREGSRQSLATVSTTVDHLIHPLSAEYPPNPHVAEEQPKEAHIPSANNSLASDFPGENSSHSFLASVPISHDHLPTASA